MKHHFIQARDLDEAHFLAVREVWRHGDIYTIERGSFVGNQRKELPHCTLMVDYPGTRPLAPQLPEGVPAPTTDEKIEKYFAHYIYSEVRVGTEQYTYGTYIAPQLDAVVEMLRDKPGTNQACITIGSKDSIMLSDPPCLRTIDCRVDRDGKLHFILYFRSWDCWAGLPENLGGLQLLKEVIAEQIGAKDGKLVATTKGLHLYDYQWPFAKQRLGEE